MINLSPQIFDVSNIKFGKTCRGTVWVQEEQRVINRRKIPDHTVGFLGIPKNGSSGTRLQLKLNQFMQFDDIPSDYYVFTIVRNPVTRIVSAYIEITQKCTHHPEGRYHDIDLPQDKVAFLDDLAQSGDDFSRFSVYLDKIEQEWGFYEGHCVPQVIYLTDSDGRLRDVEIFKLENLKPLQDKLSSKGLTVDYNTVGNEWATNSTSDPNLKTRLISHIFDNQEMMAQLKRLYKHDFTIWEQV
jgi:hypothetical protein